jgi:hypothetical protein
MMMVDYLYKIVSHGILWYLNRATKQASSSVYLRNGAGANVNAVNKHNATPLMMALKHKNEECYPEIAAFLRRNGAWK